MSKDTDTPAFPVQEMELLREREKKYRQWFEDAPISLWEQDYSEVKRRIDEIKGRNVGELEAYFHARPELVRELAGLVRVADVNSFTLQMYKATSKEVFLSGITKVFSRESYDDFIPALIAVADGRKRLSVEKTHVALDGEVLNVQLHWAVAPGFEETYGRILVSIVDITERKGAERLLERRSSERRLLLDTLPVQVWYLTDPDTYGAVNRAHADFFGRHPKDLAYKRLEEFTPPDVARAWRQGNIEGFRTKQPVHTEEWVPNAAGDPRLIAVTRTPRLNEDGHVQWVVCTGVDITDQRRIEMRVRDSEARFRHIFELSPAGIELYDGDGRLVLVNPACLEIFGIQDAEEIRRFDLFDDPNLDEPLKEKLRRGEMVQYDVAFDFEKVREAALYRTTKQGTIHLQVIINPMPRNGADGPAWYLVLVSDITDRTLKEQQLRETEERLREAQHLAHIGVWNWDSRTDVVTWTHELYLIAGLDPEGPAPTYSQHPGLYTPESWDRLKTAVEQTLKTGEQYQLELELIRPNGDTRWVDIFGGPAYDEHGGISGLYGTVQDITERKRVQDELAHERETLSMVIDGTRAGTWEWHVQTGEAVFNERWAEIAGYRLEDLRPLSIQTWTDLCHPEDLERSDRLLKAHFSGQLPYYECECRVRHKDGYWVWIKDRGKVVRWSEQGEPLLMTGTHMDVTARKEAEAERLVLERRLHQVEKTESLSRMAAAVAHHFNNMLGAVMGNLELARMDLPEGEGVARRLSEAYKATRRAADMSRLMLTFLGQTPSSPILIDLSKTCLDRLAELRGGIQDRVALETDIPMPGAVVKADPGQIGQVLSILVTNAREGMGDEGGRIRVSLSTANRRDIRGPHRFPVDWEPSTDAYACVSVSDTGSGIRPGIIDRIFDPFFTEKFTGRGLGLAVALGIVKSLGGCITVESRVGTGRTGNSDAGTRNRADAEQMDLEASSHPGEGDGGSVFRVFLPLSSEGLPETLPEQPAAVQKMDGGGGILLVEDQKIVRDAAGAMLEHLGFEVFTAEDGVEAVEIFRDRAHDIRLVLTDLSMPRMNGWETLKTLRKIRPDIPVILASGYDEARAMSGDHADQPQAFLSKPYQMATLRAALYKALGGR